MAVYAPEEVTTAIYPGITPINLFRLVFSKEFGQDLPLLPDLHFYSTIRDFRRLRAEKVHLPQLKSCWQIHTMLYQRKRRMS